MNPTFESRAVDLRVAQPVEYRDPKAATQALRWVTPGRVQPPDWDATQAFNIAYYSNVVVYACVRVLANTLASLPFRAGADPDNPLDHNPNARLAQLLGPAPGGPAPKLSARRLWAWTVAQRVVTGRYGWEIEFTSGTKGQVVALWPLASSALLPVPSEQGNEWFTGFEYGRRDRPKHLKPDQIVYGWNPSGTDFRQPESDLQAAHLDVSVAVMQDRYDYAFLRNDARPAALVVTEAFAEQEDFEAFKQQWHSQYGGIDNAGRTAFIEATEGGATGAVDVKVLGMNAKDSQSAQRYASKLNNIAIGLGVPWSLLDASGRTYDNAGQEIINFWQQRMLPLLADLQDEINMQLAPRLGTEIGWFDTTKVVALKEQNDPVSAKVGANTLLLATIMTRNEARADYGLEPLPGGDVILSAEEIQSLTGQENVGAEGGTSSAGKSTGGSPTAGSVEPPDVDEKPESDTEGARVVRLAREIRRRRLNDRTQKRQDRLIRFWDGEWAEFFESQGRSVIARLKSNRGRRAVAGKEERAPVDEVFDSLHWLDKTMKLSRKMVISAGEEGTDDYLGRLGIDFDLAAPGVTEFIDNRVNQLAGNVNETTYKQIKKALGEGIGLGEGVPVLSERITQVFDVANSRATTIARTEVIGAYNGAATARANSLPADVVGGQEWLATADNRTRDDHLAADGQVVGINEAFNVGGEPMQYPGDPAGSPENVINCRCTVAFLTPEEFKELSPERMAKRERASAILSMVRQGMSLDERVLRIALEAA